MTQPHPLWDSHCHLDMAPLSADTDAVLARARDRGVTDIVVPAYDEPGWDRLDALAARPGLHAAYGIHPWLAHHYAGAQDRDGALVRLAARLDAAPAVAVGEIGLDTKIPESDVAGQLPLLEAQLQLAADRDLPVILHCRGAFEELLAALENFGGRLRGVLHAFSRGPDLGRRFIAAGMHVAFGGSITRPTAKRPRKGALRLPLARILLETDAPGIGLDGVPAAETEPHHVADVARALATLRGLPVAEIAAATSANARTLFLGPDTEGGTDP